MINEEKIVETITSTRQRKITSISLVIPVFNELGNIEPLYNEVIDVLKSSSFEFEIIFVDDGSRDNTKNIILQICKRDSRVKLVELRNNFGQSTAISIGFSVAKGQVAVTLDADLQNDPHDIPKLIEKVEEGYDVVSGWRKNRKDPIGKKISSRISNWLARKLTGLQIHDNGCTLKAYHKDSFLNLVLYGENHRYIPALVAGDGFKVTEVVVNHRVRLHGSSKYGAGRLLRGFLDLINLAFLTKYVSRPFQFYGKIGVISVSTGILIGLYKLLQLIIAGLPLDVGPLLLFSVLLILSGIQFILFGFFAEMQTKMYLTNNLQNTKIKQIHHFSKSG